MINQIKLELSDALQNAFTPAGFDRMLHWRVNKRRYDFVGDQEFPEIVYQVIEAADRENWLAKLIAGAKEANPGNLQLEAFIEKYPEYNSSHPPIQRAHIGEVLRETQTLINENLLANENLIINENLLTNQNLLTNENLFITENLILFKNTLQDTLDKIDVISDYMTLHDELHNLIFAIFPLIEDAARQLPDGKHARSDLAKYDKTLHSAIAHMREATQGERVKAEESEWIDELDQARKQLKAVLDDFDKEKLEIALTSLRDILEIQPTRINNKLWHAIVLENARLLDLIEILEKVLSQMKKITPAPAGMTKFETGVESLKTLKAKLDALLNEYDTWREVTDQLVYLGDLLDSNLSKFKTKWQKIRAKVAPFYVGKIDEETAVDLAIADSQLEQALSTERPASEKAALEQIFAYYSERATWRFYDVTTQLLKRVEYLRDIHRQLPES